MFNRDALFEFAYIIFGACIDKWGISNNVMAMLIDKFSLTSLIQKNEEYYNSMGIDGIIEELEKHIEKQGGSIYGWIWDNV